MFISKEIENIARDEIIISVNDLIDRWMKDGLSVYDIKKFFKSNKNLQILINDINRAGRRYFKQEQEGDYTEYVRMIFNTVISDRISETETLKIQKNISEKKIVKYYNFLNESIKFDGMTIDHLFTDLEYSKDDIDIISDYYKTRKEYINNKNPKYSTYTVTNFKTDVSQNNRSSFDVLLLSETQLITIIKNIIKYILSGLYSQIPEEISFNDVVVKPHTFIDKKSLNESIGKMINKEDVLKYISELSNYEFDSKWGDYYLYKKVK